ncbi:MAG: UvrD-helicase domain-containing protein [Metamycoplasmataceae bacterium]
MNNNVIDLLNKEQEPIIMSNSNKIIVSAGPGSGKTHTIIERVKAKYNNNNNDFAKTTIICSFTNNSANDLRLSVESLKINTDKVQIKTLDSFVYDIINSFKNRWLSKWNIKISSENMVKIIPKRNSEWTKCDLSEKNDKSTQEYCKEKWFDEMKNNNYYFLFPTYLYAIQMIQDLKTLRLFLAAKYDAIYVDEAQDLNKYQYKFIEKLSELCDLSIFMVGDENQILYEWRGASRTMFSNLINNPNYDHFRIKNNIRCNENIIYFANKFIGIEDIELQNPEERVRSITDINVELINDIASQGNYLILCDTKEAIKEAYEKIKDVDHELILVNDIDFTNFTEWQDFIEEILRFYYNFNNKIPSFIYKFSEYKSWILMHRKEKRLTKNQITILKNINVTPIEYIKNISKFLENELSNELLQYLSGLLIKQEYANKYIMFKNKNRIMTIHASKGLEAKSVLVYHIDNDIHYKYELKESDKSKYYVAFTRAQENLYIKTKKQAIVSLLEEYKNYIKIKEKK